MCKLVGQGAPNLNKFNKCLGELPCLQKWNLAKTFHTASIKPSWGCRRCSPAHTAIKLLAVGNPKERQRLHFWWSTTRKYILDYKLLCQNTHHQVQRLISHWPTAGFNTMAVANLLPTSHPTTRGDIDVITPAPRKLKHCRGMDWNRKIISQFKCNKNNNQIIHAQNYSDLWSYLNNTAYLNISSKSNHQKTMQHSTVFECTALT